MMNSTNGKMNYQRRNKMNKRISKEIYQNFKGRKTSCWNNKEK